MEYFKNKLIKITDTGIGVNTEVKLGVFINELNAVSERIQPYALIMGSQGKTQTERIIFGGHTGIAIKNYKWPLITVPVTASFTAIKNIGVAYYFKKMINTDFIEEIKLLANDFKADIHILNAAKEEEFNGDFILLSSTLERLLAPNKINFHFVAGERINRSIMEYAEKNKIDLLILMPKHKNLWEEFIGSSHSKQIVLNSHVPVLSLA